MAPFTAFRLHTRSDVLLRPLGVQLALEDVDHPPQAIAPPMELASSGAAGVEGFQPEVVSAAGCQLDRRRVDDIRVIGALAP